jgi:hypothetical protein
MRLHLNKILPFFLITAFLAVQMSVTHIHLAENHDHDGSHHQHNVQAHAYYASSHHADTIDSTHAIDDTNVIEFDNDGACSGCVKVGSKLIASITNADQLLFSFHSAGIQLPERGSNRQKYTTYSTVRLRAPPQLS